MPADTYSTLLRLLMMADGNDANTWGDNTSTNLNLLEQAIAQQTSVDLSQFSGDNYTLTTLNGAQDDSRAVGIETTGALTSGTGNVTVTFPNVPRLYVFNNQCSNNQAGSNPSGYTITATTAAGVATYICLSGVQVIYCDGNANMYGASLPPTVAASLEAYQAFMAGQAVPFVQVGYGADTTIDPSESNNFYMIFGTSPTGTTLSITNSTTQLDGQTIRFVIQQSSDGDGTISWPSDVVWAGGAPPVLSSVGNAVDIVEMTWDAAAASWYADITQGYNSSGTTSSTIVISQNTVDWSIPGTFTGTPTINIEVAAGVTVSASGVNTAALNCSNAPSGAIVNLTNNGTILGAGGRGGAGGYGVGVNTQFGPVGYDPEPGEHGGTAIIGPGAGITFNIFNNGVISGGGGGGGGGGYSASGNTTISSGGGGGGLGAFGGRGGRATQVRVNGSGAGDLAAGGSGQDASPGINGGNGNNTAMNGGSGDDVSGTGAAADGGSGGTLGSAGTDGGTPTGGTLVSLDTNSDGGVGGWGVNNNNQAFNAFGETVPTYGSNYAGSGTQNWPIW